LLTSNRLKVSNYCKIVYSLRYIDTRYLYLPPTHTHIKQQGQRKIHQLGG